MDTRTDLPYSQTGCHYLYSGRTLLRKPVEDAVSDDLDIKLLGTVYPRRTNVYRVIRSYLPHKLAARNMLLPVICKLDNNTGLKWQKILTVKLAPSELLNVLVIQQLMRIWTNTAL